jgi:hypothetical protein
LSTANAASAKDFGVRGHVRALTKGQHVATLQTSIGGGASVFLAIENLKSKI